MLTLAFGHAGYRIISQGLSEIDEDIDIVKSCQKVYGIYGFCDIRNFTDATEALEVEVMIFINQISDIVHSTTYSFQGAPNKNIGDAFLLVWNINSYN